MERTALIVWHQWRAAKFHSLSMRVRSRRVWLQRQAAYHYANARFLMGIEDFA